MPPSGLYLKASFCKTPMVELGNPRQLSMTARCGVLDGHPMGEAMGKCPPKTRTVDGFRWGMQRALGGKH